jgi:glycerol-3-phosphate acyltransferase PlsY
LELAISFLAVIGAYLIGSLSFAVIVSRAFGLSDPRSYGSKNPGATNVLRSGNKAAAAVTLLLDALKGWLPVWAANHWAGVAGFGDGTLALVGLAAFIGHLFPVFFKFKGGKGVATAAGVLFGVDWLLGLLTLLAWVAVVAVSRYSSLGALAAAVFAPVCYLMGSGSRDFPRRQHSTACGPASRSPISRRNQPRCASSTSRPVSGNATRRFATGRRFPRRGWKSASEKARIARSGA